jgi:hypothetical protein
MPLPFGFIQPCLPTKAPQPPTGDAWLHEIKHDGFRVIARKDGALAHLIEAHRPWWIKGLPYGRARISQQDQTLAHQACVCALVHEIRQAEADSPACVAMTMRSPLLPAADMLPHWLWAAMCQKATSMVIFRACGQVV